MFGHWSFSLHYLWPGDTEARPGGITAGWSWQGLHQWPGTSLSCFNKCRERRLTPTKQESTASSTQRQAEILIFFVCAQRSNNERTYMLDSHTPSGPFIHLSHKHWPPLHLSVPSYIRWGLGKWQRLPAILELPDRDKILVSWAEEGVESGKCLLLQV